MKRQLILLFAALLISCNLAPIAAAQATDWDKINVPALPVFHPRQPKRIALPNGMVIFLQEDHELPLIEGTIRIRGGSRSEPAAKIGMLDIYGEVWRTGGTKAQTGDQMDDFLEVRAAKVETDDNADSTTLSWSCLKGDFDDVFKVVNDLLRNPEFRDEKVDLSQKELFDAISRRNDDAAGIAGREAMKLAYGAQNPYARSAEYATVAAVTRQDLLTWHKDHVSPNNMLLGIVGDFDSAAMEAKLRQAFGTWVKGPATPQEKIEFHPAKPGFYLIPKDDVNQSNIRMVALGTRRDDPDYYAIQVFNEAFGGASASRLYVTIRSKMGLAYSVGGGIGASFDHPGVTRISMGTKSGTTAESIRALFEQIDGLAQNKFTDVEIKRAKDSILNSFVFNFDSPDKVLREQMAYEFYGYPADYLQRFQAGVEKVTSADVARAAARLHKDQLAVLVVGNTAEFDKPLSALGPVTNIDIAIAPPPGQPSAQDAKPASSNPEGKALIAKVVNALGGTAKLQSVKALKSDITLTQGGSPVDLHVTIVFPDRMHVDVQSPMGQMTLVVSPGASFRSMVGQGSQNLPPAMKTEYSQQIRRDIIYIAQHADDPAFSFAAGGSEKIGDLDASILDVSGGDVAMRWFVDQKTGRVVREIYQAMGQSGPSMHETDLDDWQTQDGLTLSRLHTNKENGEVGSTAKFTSIQINPSVDPSLFAKPAEAAKGTQ